MEMQPEGEGAVGGREMLIRSGDLWVGRDGERQRTGFRSG